MAEGIVHIFQAIGDFIIAILGASIMMFATGGIFPGTLILFMISFFFCAPFLGYKYRKYIWGKAVMGIWVMIVLMYTIRIIYAYLQV